MAEMDKNYLNVQYAGDEERLNIQYMKSLSEVKEKIESSFDEITVSISKIQLWDVSGTTRYRDLGDIPGIYFLEPKQGGLYLLIKLKNQGIKLLIS